MRRPSPRFLVSLTCLSLGTSACGDGDKAHAGRLPVPDPAATPIAFPESVASGDPRPDSVVLWTRLASSYADGDAMLTVTLATDPEFGSVVTSRSVTARASTDHAVKLRVEGLAPDTTYYYRFEFDGSAVPVQSQVGRTRTAPDPDSDAPVRFAFFSCQDFKSRYYNAYAHLLATYAPDDIDFLVYLGDYIYETASREDAPQERRIDFSDQDGAIPVPSEYGDDVDLAASSLSNYRELYQRYRTDPMLQRLHELYPVIAIWDDHEFSDDSWQADSTDTAGKEDEWSVERKRNAERAFFENMPIEAGIDESTSELGITEDDLFPSTAIYRSFRWGKHLDLILTDYRSFRSDHLIPEDAFPGAIAVPAGEGVPEIDAYVDFDSGQFTTERASALPLVAELYANAGLDELTAQERASAVLRGFVSAVWLDSLSATATGARLFSDSALEALPRGLSFASVGKSDLFSAQGSRYVVNQEYYLTYAKLLAEQAGGARLADVLGPAQEDWLRETLATSGSTWRLFASSVSLLPFMLDFTHPIISALLPEGFPERLRRPWQLNADQWDGFPLQKEELLLLLGETPNTVIISGDIHSSFVGGHELGVEGSSPVYEFTGTAVSSITMDGFTSRLATELAGTENASWIDDVASSLGLILKASANGNALLPHDSLDFADTGSNGYVVVEVNGEEVRARFHHYPSSQVFNSYYDDVGTLTSLFEEPSFVVRGGALLRE